MVRRLHRHAWGSGPRTVVLLHGSTSSGRTWWRVGPWLADRGWTVVALDLPSHGQSPPAGEPLTPQLASEEVAAELAGVARGSVDLVVGHSFGAAVALTLAAREPQLVAGLVLEELPGPTSVDWSAEAEAVLNGADSARRDRATEIGQVRAAQPRWHGLDCQHAVEDLARCHAPDVAAGLAQGAHWLPTGWPESFPPDTLLLLAPDAAGVNRLEDATALRGADRAHAMARVDETVVIPAGHCIHRDDPHAWLRAVVTRTTI